VWCGRTRRAGRLRGRGGSAAPARVRWTLTAGIGLFAAVLVLRLRWHREQAADFGWFAYAPPRAHPGRGST
jgi:hypothetical protein